MIFYKLNISDSVHQIYNHFDHLNFKELFIVFYSLSFYMDDLFVHRMEVFELLLIVVVYHE
jgi:hypothetical protein